MIRGTTPTHTFILDFDTQNIKTIEITYAQNDVVLLTKGNNDCTFDGKKVSTKLTQEDTFLFNKGNLVKVQIRILSLNGNVCASSIMQIRCDELLSDGVIE